jgi:hypothetical protein
MNYVKDGIPSIAIGRTETGATGRVEVGTTVTLIRPANQNRLCLVVKNLHETETIYVGFTDAITTLTGFPVVGGQAIIFDTYLGPLYGISEGTIVPIVYSEI